MNERNKLWLRCAGTRAIKTIAQTAIATIGTAMVIAEVNWSMVISASLLAGLLSLLTSIAGIPEVDMTEYQKDEEILYPEDDEEPEDKDENVSEGD